MKIIKYSKKETDIQIKNEQLSLKVKKAGWEKKSKFKSVMEILADITSTTILSEQNNHRVQWFDVYNS
jgi:uncharacterized protein Smg (DUF494 family)